MLKCKRNFCAVEGHICSQPPLAKFIGRGARTDYQKFAEFYNLKFYKCILTLKIRSRGENLSRTLLILGCHNSTFMGVNLTPCGGAK